MKLDILALAAHPDDVELACGGFLLEMKKKGFRTGIVDLTKGEMGSRGNLTQREKEAKKGASLLKVDWRENLDLGDARLEVTLPNRHALASVIRRLQPTFIVAPYWEDEHPDHAACGRLTKSAIFDARIIKLDLGFPPYTVKKIFYYFAHAFLFPSVVADITDSFSEKMAAVLSYGSQFSPTPTARQEYEKFAPLPISDYLFHVESRCRYFGSLIGVRYGEGFLTEGPVLLSDPYLLIKQK